MRLLDLVVLTILLLSITKQNGMFENLKKLLGNNIYPHFLLSICSSLIIIVCNVVEKLLLKIN